MSSPPPGSANLATLRCPGLQLGSSGSGSSSLGFELKLTFTFNVLEPPR